MIRLPQRSVTRFFIPLIDVLTLLFCTFLLLPVFNAAVQSHPEDGARNPEQAKAEKIRELQEHLPFTRILEIGTRDGKLIYRTPETPDGRVLADEVDAQKLIDRDRQNPLAVQNGLYYLILYPRDPDSEFPLAGQYRRYEEWLRDVAHGYERPGKGIALGGKA